VRWTESKVQGPRYLTSEDGRWLINKAMGPAGWTYMLVALNPSRIVCVGSLAECKAACTAAPSPSPPG
jgi:hypothetical protein